MTAGGRGVRCEVIRLAFGNGEGETRTPELVFQFSRIQDPHRTNPFITVNLAILVRVNEFEQMARYLWGVSFRLTVALEEFGLVDPTGRMSFPEI